MSAATISERLAFAREVALAAGAEVQKRYGDVHYTLKRGDSPVTEADLASNGVIVASIRGRYPGDAILSEESKDTTARLDAELVWIVDPLDGTKEFLSANGEFAVMIGLARWGEPVAGVVYAPARRVLYSAVSGGGAWIERDGGGRIPLRCGPARMDALRLVGSRSHPDPVLARMETALGVSDVQASGSVGIKCGLIAEGKRDVYIHPTPHLKEWDTCAPEVVLVEAGGRVTDCRGARLGYNKRSPVQPHGIVACNAAVAEQVLARIRPVYVAGGMAGG